MTSEGLVSEPAFAGGGTGGGDGEWLKRRWGGKVYTRRSKNAKTIDDVPQVTRNGVELTVAELPNQAVSHGIAKLVCKNKLRLLSTSNEESRGLKRKFENELETVRVLMKKVGIEGEAFHRSDDASVCVERLTTPSVYALSMRPLNQLCVGGLGNSFGIHEITEKRTPKANQLYTNSEFIMANDKFLLSAKSNEKKSHGSVVEFRVGSKTFKSCSALLEKLLKHRFSRIFDSPVDVKGLGLHDYFNIIKQPMDLGTVKERLSSNHYNVPRQFADDVRLTFHNAMTYNPEGHEVHTIAKMLLKIFEDKWAVIETEYLKALQIAYHNDVVTPTSARSTPLAPTLLSPCGGRFLSRSQTMMNPVDYRSEGVVRGSAGKVRALKKPKAKDLNKRDMTYAEKQKLGSSLQSLPIEKVDGIVQIIKRRNAAVSNQTNEIEVDIDAVDKETLWELDRYITNQRKNLSKMKRRNELAAHSGSEANNVMPRNSMAVELAPVQATDGAVVEEPLAGTKTGDKIASPSNVVPPNVVNDTKSSSSSSSSSDTGSPSSKGSDSESSPDGSDVKRAPES